MFQQVFVKNKLISYLKIALPFSAMVIMISIVGNWKWMSSMFFSGSVQSLSERYLKINHSLPFRLRYNPCFSLLHRHHRIKYFVFLQISWILKILRRLKKFVQESRVFVTQNRFKFHGPARSMLSYQQIVQNTCRRLPLYSKSGDNFPLRRLQLTKYL